MLNVNSKISHSFVRFTYFINYDKFTRITREYKSKELNKSFNSLKQQCLERYTND